MTEDNFTEEHRRHGILEEIKAERIRQIGKWGTTRTRDQHWNAADWYEMISDYNAWARRMWSMGSLDKARRRFIQVAALAVAAVEAIDAYHIPRIQQIIETVNGLTSPAAVKEMPKVGAMGHGHD